MSQINNITINIALQTLPISQKGFGLPLIAGTKARSQKPDFVEVSDADELLDSGIGFVSTDPEYKMAMAIFSQSPRLEKIAVCHISAFAQLATELAAYRNNGYDNWYYLLITSRDKNDIMLADEYINSLEKIGMFATHDKTINSTGERTIILISSHADEYPDAAWIGRCAAEKIGSITWDSKQLSGQKNSTISGLEQTTILANNFNVLREMGGVVVTWEGKTASGQYIDNIQGRDYLKARLTEALQSLKINNKKIPMDGRGIALTEACMREVFRDAGRNGVIAPVVDSLDRAKSDLGDYQYKLSLPDSISGISTNDRANRKLLPITFTATVGGGINKFEINGIMEV
jgi:hypothetical protein